MQQPLRLLRRFLRASWSGGPGSVKTDNVPNRRRMDGTMVTSNGHLSKPRAKLTGRAFYESLGSPKMILAPMVDQSEFAWRMLTRSFMTPDSSKDLLAYTPMLHARMFLETGKFRDHHFQPTKAGLASRESSKAETAHSDMYLDGNPSFDRPLTVQFCANEPDELLEAAKYVQPYCDAVDLNLGCPQGIARKGKYGAFLQEDWHLVYKLINNLHRNLDVPVSAKIRILETKEKTLEYAKMILSAGASILTVHGRQRDQKGHKTGLADWSTIRYLRNHLPPDTVLFANGNILRHEDIAKCLEETGADGIMSAEGNLYDPAIFAAPPPLGNQSREYWRGRDGKGGYRMDAVFRRYLNILYKHVLEVNPPHRAPLFLPSDPPSPPSNGVSHSENQDTTEPPSPKRRKLDPKPASPNLLAMQPHLFHLLRPLITQHHPVRDALARCRAGDMLAFEHVLTLVEAVTREGLLDYDAHPENYEESPEEGNAAQGRGTGMEEELTDHESSLVAVRACKRPWWVCQPYVRPLPREALEKGSLTLSKRERRQMENQGGGKGVEEGVRGEGASGSGMNSQVEGRGGMTERERLDERDGVPKGEVVPRAMVAG